MKVYIAMYYEEEDSYTIAVCLTSELAQREIDRYIENQSKEIMGMWEGHEDIIQQSISYLKDNCIWHMQDLIES